LDRLGEFRNRLECSGQAAAGKSGARPHGIRRGKNKSILFSPARGIGLRDHSATRLARKSSSHPAALRLRRMEPWREHAPCGGGIQRRERPFPSPRASRFPSPNDRGRAAQARPPATPPAVIKNALPARSCRRFRAAPLDRDYQLNL
jgi:hypothetical protein